MTCLCRDRRGSDEAARLSAIWCDDPVIVIENRTLYHAGKQEVRLGGEVQPIGGAAVLRPGCDVTVLTWGALQHRVLEAADRLAAEGIDAEVIDARWVRPLDLNTVLDSVRRTGRLVVTHEAHTVGGVGGEVVAAVAEAGVPLRCPPVRIGTPDVRIPAALGLAAAVIPSAEVIAEAIANSVHA